MIKKTINWLIKLTLLLFLLPSFARPEDPNICYNPTWQTIRKLTDKNQLVVIYKVPTDYSITATNLSCVLVKEFLSSTNNLPTQAVVGLISEDGRSAFLAKWSMKEDYLMFIEAHIAPLEYTTEGLFTIYPQPLQRIKDIMLAKKLPMPEDLPLCVRNKFKTNYVETSIFQLKALLKGDV